MGRKVKSKEEKDEKRRIRQNRYYQRHKDRIKRRNLEQYYKKVEKELSCNVGVNKFILQNMF